MIIHSFRTDSEPVISLESCYGPQRHLVDICIVTFSDQIFASVLASRACEQIAHIRSCNGGVSIYAFPHSGLRVACYLSPIGSVMAATCVMEAHWLTGASKFIFFGSAGCLDREAVKGKYIIPTAAYRDEGISYHYAPPADYIVMPGAEKTAAILTRLGIPHVLGKTWTTDGFYRELRCHLEKRKKEGCLAVEMEAASVQAVCDFYGLELYYFLMAGDVLDLPQWDAAELHQANHHLDNFQIALKIAEEI